MHTQFSFDNLKRRDQLGDLGAVGGDMKMVIGEIEYDEDCIDRA
jgi:hypothetical protein